MRFISLSALAAVSLTMTACYDSPQNISSTGNECLPTHSLVERDGNHGVIFKNDCSVCYALAFDYKDVVTGEMKQMGCFVPSLTRVAVWQVSEYTVKSSALCDAANKRGKVGTITVEEMQRNYRTGRCIILGEFAD